MTADHIPTVAQPAPVPACAVSGYDPDLWAEASGMSVRANRVAADVCRTCPLLVACSNDAEARRLEPEEFGVTVWRPSGIWGGRLYDGTRRPPVLVIGPTR